MPKIQVDVPTFGILYIFFSINLIFWSQGISETHAEIFKISYIANIYYLLYDPEIQITNYNYSGALTLFSTAILRDYWILHFYVFGGYVLRMRTRNKIVSLWLYVCSEYPSGLKRHVFAYNSRY